MAFIKPFCGVRYAGNDIYKLICPPYDIISAREKLALKKLSPHNMVRLELPDPFKSESKYRRSAYLFNLWREKGVLKTDSKPAYYFYEQSFHAHGKDKVRCGFFAALKLEDPQKGEIKPHEKTLPKPKQDRLDLLREVRANLSPIFGLYSDINNKTINFSKEISKTDTAAYAKDREGVLHKLWKIENSQDVEWIGEMLSTQNIFIADGHHRYETAWNYLQERSQQDKDYSAQSEYNYVLSFLCPMEEEGLVILPTHRVAQEPPDFENMLNEYFDILPAEEFAALSETSPQPVLVYKNNIKRTLVIKNKESLVEFMPDKCAAYQNLGVSILHSFLLRNVAPDKITYVKDEKEAYKLAKTNNHIAVIVPPTPVEAVKEIALSGQTMPQKSTFFYPKVATGMVVHSVE